MTQKYHVEVLVLDKATGENVWTPMRPTGGQPYLFDKDEAQKWADTMDRGGNHPFQGGYRVVEAPASETGE